MVSGWCVIERLTLHEIPISFNSILEPVGLQCKEIVRQEEGCFEGKRLLRPGTCVQVRMFLSPMAFKEKMDLAYVTVLWVALPGDRRKTSTYGRHLLTEDITWTSWPRNLVSKFCCFPSLFSDAVYTR